MSKLDLLKRAFFTNSNPASTSPMMGDNPEPAPPKPNIPQKPSTTTPQKAPPPKAAATPPGQATPYASKAAALKQALMSMDALEKTLKPTYTPSDIPVTWELKPRNKEQVHEVRDNTVDYDYQSKRAMLDSVLGRVSEPDLLNMAQSIRRNDSGEEGKTKCQPVASSPRPSSN